MLLRCDFGHRKRSRLRSRCVPLPPRHLSRALDLPDGGQYPGSSTGCASSPPRQRPAPKLPPSTKTHGPGLPPSRSRSTSGNASGPPGRNRQARRSGARRTGRQASSSPRSAPCWMLRSTSRRRSRLAYPRRHADREDLGADPRRQGPRLQGRRLILGRSPGHEQRPPHTGRAWPDRRTAPGKYRAEEAT